MLGSLRVDRMKQVYKDSSNTDNMLTFVNESYSLLLLALLEAVAEKSSVDHVSIMFPQALGGGWGRRRISPPKRHRQLQLQPPNAADTQSSRYTLICHFFRTASCITNLSKAQKAQRTRTRCDLDQFTADAATI